MSCHTKVGRTGGRAGTAKVVQRHGGRLTRKPLSSHGASFLCRRLLPFAYVPDVARNRSKRPNWRDRCDDSIASGRIAFADCEQTELLVLQANLERLNLIPRGSYAGTA